MVQDGVGSIEKLGLPAAPEGTMPFGVAMDVVFFFVFVCFCCCRRRCRS